MIIMQQGSIWIRYETIVPPSGSSGCSLSFDDGPKSSDASAGLAANRDDPEDAATSSAIFVLAGDGLRADTLLSLG